MDGNFSQADVHNHDNSDEGVPASEENLNSVLGKKNWIYLGERFL
jgi:hypothetical protein